MIIPEAASVHIHSSLCFLKYLFVETLECWLFEGTFPSVLA